MRSTDITVRDVSIAFEDYSYRTPIKFGGVALDRVTILNVGMVVESALGKKGKGFGSMPLGNVWAWPTKELTYDQTLAGMKYIAGRIAGPYRMSRTLRPPDRHHRRTRTAILPPGQRLRADEPPRPAGPQARDARGRLGLRRGAPRRLRQAARAQLLPDLRPASSSTTTSAHYLGEEFAGERLHEYITDRAQAADAALSPRRRARPAHARRRDEARRRRPARTPRRVDRARRPHAPEDQAQRRRPGLGRGARRDRERSRGGESSRNAV